jgi:hypothetical protein
VSHLDYGFGVELECYLPIGTTHAQAAAAVARRIGEPCAFEGYNHHLRPTWKVVTDGSLGDYARGAEFVSPILRGEAGLHQLEQVCEALTDFGCTVNRTCGLHVHVGVGNRPLQFFKSITKLYGIYESVIDGMMPTSRRANSNLYCRSMTSASPAAIDRAQTMHELISVATARCNTHVQRYFKVNLTAHARHRTVEFRQHGGTLDATRARNWTVLCLRMIDAASRGINFGASSEAPRNRAKPGTQSHLVGELLLRPEGVTQAEIQAVTGGRSRHVPSRARACGIEITSQRMGRSIRYFAVVAQSATLDVSIDGFCNLIGASTTERTYVETRTATLAVAA